MYHKPDLLLISIRGVSGSTLVGVVTIGKNWLACCSTASHNGDVRCHKRPKDVLLLLLRERHGGGDGPHGAAAQQLRLHVSHNQGNNQEAVMQKVMVVL